MLLRSQKDDGVQGPAAAPVRHARGADGPCRPRGLGRLLARVRGAGYEEQARMLAPAADERGPMGRLTGVGRVGADARGGGGSGLRSSSYEEAADALAPPESERDGTSASGPVVVVNQAEVIEKALQVSSAQQIVAEGKEKIDLFHVIRNEGQMWRPGTSAADMDARVDRACVSLFRWGGGIGLTTHGYTLRSGRRLDPFEFRQYYLQRARLSWLSSLANAGVGWATQRISLAARDLAVFE